MTTGGFGLFFEPAGTHNKKAGLDSLCEVVQGNYLEMPFPENSFDGAYSIEATCHAPKLEEVYAEIFRVLKPGSLYVSYEWVTTDKYEKRKHRRFKEQTLTYDSLQKT
ncbi:hypothetical protein OIU79_026104 [Salix purpurea]|uniref:SAM-dependent methyltransferase Erg6/SMT-type domain-containing protein n=1 Tax=Salix purpurea TaxID=77065 RepID=A0A9Q0NL67_SALPP|nr:hypothetical protein OIU79_026104 [Salix purpurea]